MTGSQPLRVILNPAASGGRGGRLRTAVEEGLRKKGVPFLLTTTREAGHARELAGELARVGTEVILVVGGDGTIHEVANGVLEAGGSTPALAVAPVGTGNDFFRIVGAPRRLESAVELVMNGRVVRVDVGIARFGEQERHFVNLMGVGLDVDVLRRRYRFTHLSGLPQYLAALVATLVSFKPFALHVELGLTGDHVSGPTLISGMTVGPSIGGGFMISPGASPHDGLLDFFFVEPLGVIKVARYIPRVIRGTHGDLPEFHSGKVPRARFSRSDGGPFFFELDGELMPSPVTELDVEVRPGALPVIVPRKAG
jgi:diacylglycerol kinase (ATP)